ncbi:MAG: hypothetical protein M0Z47_01950 [Actinomycetota bacterium]|nr:hypothetical protein [Actinomycetota bacterium]
MLGEEWPYCDGLPMGDWARVEPMDVLCAPSSDHLLQANDPTSCGPHLGPTPAGVPAVSNPDGSSPAASVGLTS